MARCQTCGARAELLEQYEREIAALRLALRSTSARNQGADDGGSSAVPGGLRELGSPVNDPAKRAPSPTPTTDKRGPKIIARWRVEETVRERQHLGTAMAEAFRRAAE